MLNNNNKAVINRLYRKMLKQNRLRNRVTILTIILTTFMFTAIFTMGFSLAENLNKMLLSQQGTKSSIYLENPSRKQIEEVGKLESVEAVGTRINAGYASEFPEWITDRVASYCKWSNCSNIYVHLYVLHIYYFASTFFLLRPQRYIITHASIRTISATTVPSIPNPTLYAKLFLAVEASSLNTENGTVIPLFGKPNMIFCVKFHAACAAIAHQMLSI